ncbi:hypothetical protein C0J52_13647 [Blattella germanica]|nr:hypothetical protein C0J52_13647 [Blattella germanica]
MMKLRLVNSSGRGSKREKERDGATPPSPANAEDAMRGETICGDNTGVWNALGHLSPPSFLVTPFTFRVATLKKVGQSKRSDTRVQTGGRFTVRTSVCDM